MPTAGVGDVPVASYLIAVPGSGGKPEHGQIGGAEDGECIARRADCHELPRFGRLGGVQ